MFEARMFLYHKHPILLPDVLYKSELASFVWIADVIGNEMLIL